MGWLTDAYNWAKDKGGDFVDWTKDRGGHIVGGLKDTGSDLISGDWGDIPGDLKEVAVDGVLGGLDVGSIVRGESPVNSEKLFGNDEEAINEELSEGVNDAITNAGENLESIWSGLSEAQTRTDPFGNKTERTLKSSLDKYDESSEANRQMLESQRDAGVSRRDEFLEPAMQGARTALANAPSSPLQPGFGHGRAMANAKASQWNTATQQALDNAKFNTGAIMANQGLAQDMLDADITPQQDLMGYQTDWATDALQSQIDLAKARALVEQSDTGVLGEIGDALRIVSPVAKMAR